MCRALDEMCENAIKETKEKYVAELKERDAEIDRLRKQLEVLKAAQHNHEPY